MGRPFNAQHCSPMVPRWPCSLENAGPASLSPRPAWGGIPKEKKNIKQKNTKTATQSESAARKTGAEGELQELKKVCFCFVCSSFVFVFLSFDLFCFVFCIVLFCIVLFINYLLLDTCFNSVIKILMKMDDWFYACPSLQNKLIFPIGSLSN